MKISELSSREKRNILVAVMALAAFVLWQLVGRPVQSRLVSLNRIVDSKKQMLRDTRQMSLDLDRLKAEIENLDTQISRQPDTGKILARLEQIQMKNGIDKMVTGMRPMTIPLGKDYEQVSVNLELMDITFEKLVEFLVDIDAMNLVIGVSHLKAQQLPSSNGHLKVTLDLQTIVTSSSP